MNIYVTRDGQNYGPYPAEQAHAMIQQGQLHAGDLACPEGQSEWVPLGQILGIPPGPSAPLSPAPQSAIPVAQPATAIYPPGHAPQPAPVQHAHGGVIPGMARAQFALQQAYRSACSAHFALGSAAALAVLGFGLPLIAMVAGNGSGGAVAGFFGKTLGLKWAAIIGLPIGLLCVWWFVVQKKKAAALSSHFESLRGGFG